MFCEVGAGVLRSTWGGIFTGSLLPIVQLLTLTLLWKKYVTTVTTSLSDKPKEIQHIIPNINHDLYSSLANIWVGVRVMRAFVLLMQDIGNTFSLISIYFKVLFQACINQLQTSNENGIWLTEPSYSWWLQWDLIEIAKIIWSSCPRKYLNYAPQRDPDLSLENTNNHC